MGIFLNYLKNSGASSGYQLRLDVGNASSYTVSLKNILMSTNVWYHVVGVWTNTYTDLYLNGVSQHYRTHSLRLNIPTDSLTICAGRPQNNSTITSFNPGAIGAVRVYNRALTGAEILQNFNATKSRFGL